MGDYIRSSPLIVIGDISTSDAPKFESVVFVREVVKGEAEVGERITIPPDGTSRYIVPREAQNVAVLFAPQREGKTELSVAEVYLRPDELTALRTLVSIYKLPGEREQLVALKEQAQQNSPVLASELINEFARMHEPRNFDIVLASFAQLDVSHQEALLQLLERIGDERALPLLIQSLNSTQRPVRYQADHALTFYFPGARGVTEAYRTLAQNPATQEEARYYLAKYDPTLAATLPPKEPTLWQQGQKQLKNGQTEAAKATFFALLEKEKMTDWGTLEAARTLLPLLNDAEKVRLRVLLTQMVKQEDSYLDAQSAIALLRELPDPTNVPALLSLLYAPNEGAAFAWEGVTRAATFALVDLGATAKQNATKSVLERMKVRLASGAQLSSNEETLYFCQLAWLADAPTWNKVMADLPEQLATRMKALQPVRDAANSPNEAAALSALLPDTQNRWQGDADRWITARLGELHDPVAAAPLFAELKRSLFSGRSSDIEAALIHIGGPPVEAGALALLQGEPDALQRSGMDILRALQGEKMRPLLRRILTEPGLGDRRHALFLLGYVGTAEDLSLLLPFADFWKGERELQSSAIAAVVGVRERYGYDVNGPIAKD